MLNKQFQLASGFLEGDSFEEFVGRYEYYETIGENTSIEWIEFYSEGKWLSSLGKKGKFKVEGPNVYLYRELFDGVLILENEGKFSHRLLNMGSKKYINPNIYDAPTQIDFIDNFVYWSAVDKAVMYQVFVDGAFYKQVEETYVFIEKKSDKLIEVKVRAIDPSYEKKNGDFITINLNQNIYITDETTTIMLDENAQNKTYNIQSDIKKLVIKGNPNTTFNNISFQIESRTEKLEIVLDHVKITNNTSMLKPIINYVGYASFLTVIEVIGSNNELRGANGSNGSNASKSGENGSSGNSGVTALNLKQVYFKGAGTINLIGGNGGNGGNGASGSFLGGKGGDGGNGGNGAVGYNAEITYYFGAKNFNGQSGTRGSGGSGASGGLFGGNGSNGLSGSTSGTYGQSIELTKLGFGT